ncbi:hypothetical protein MMC30_006816 [Trapelia coarctata]|nr:hypothetical protein [Trapelia coarctata]
MIEHEIFQSYAFRSLNGARVQILAEELVRNRGAFTFAHGTENGELDVGIRSAIYLKTQAKRSERENSRIDIVLPDWVEADARDRARNKPSYTDWREEYKRTTGRQDVPGLDVFTYIDDPFAERGVTTRPLVKDSPYGNGSFAMMLEWIRDCMLHHTECSVNPQAFQSVCRLLPKRLVHVTGDPEHPVARLYETSNGETGQYIALSYCWGKDVPLAAMTTMATLDSNKRGIDLKNLPKTYTDAFATTLRLNQHYIWIDALCIIQRSADWESEASKMGQYYGNALVTLCADAAWSSSNGFLAREPSPFDPLILSQSLPSANYETRGHLLVCRSIYDYETETLQRHVAGLWYNNVEQSPLSTRGWTLQERILAGRKIHFGADHLFWECRHSSQAEGGPAYFGTPMYFIADFAFQNFTLKRFTRDLTVKDWYYLVQRYSMRSLTHASDRLVAISGLAKVFSQVLQQPYLAGLWAHDLHGGLAWWVDSDAPVYRPDTNTAPTWSWASIEGRITANGGSGYVDKPAFTVVSATAPPMGADPFGRVAGGTLVLEGKLQRVRFEAQSPMTMFAVRTETRADAHHQPEISHSNESESDSESKEDTSQEKEPDIPTPFPLQPLSPAALLARPDMSEYLSTLKGLGFADKTHILGHSAAIGDYFDDLQLNRGGQVLWALRLSIAPVVQGPSIPSPQGVLVLERVEEEGWRGGKEGEGERAEGEEEMNGHVDSPRGKGIEDGAREGAYTYRRVGAGTTWDDAWFDDVEESVVRII